MFDRHIGIDYSGNGRADDRLREPRSRISVSMTESGGPIERMTPTPGTTHWTRRELAGWLLHRLAENNRTVIGVDHAFSFPSWYFDNNGLKDWNGFLRHVWERWPLHRRGQTVADLIVKNGPYGDVPERFRLTDRWTGGSKSVFAFEQAQGNVAFSTHAGLPWLRLIRRARKSKVHVWPFDGWFVPEGRSVIAEVYPAGFCRRWDNEVRGPDEQDAWSIAKWLSSMDANGFLRRYFDPSLTALEREQAEREGWILGLV